MNAKPGRDNASWGTSLNANLALNGLSLSSISSFETLKRREYGDWDASASVEADTFFGSDVDVISQELRLASDNDSALTWVAGFLLLQAGAERDATRRTSSTSTAPTPRSPMIQKVEVLEPVRPGGIRLR